MAGPDFSKLSDDELAQMASGTPAKAAPSASSPDFSKLSDAELSQMASGKAAYQAPQAPSSSNAFLSHVAAGGTFGFDDEIGGALGAAGRVVGIDGLGGQIKNMHFNPDGPTLNPDKIKNAYTQDRDSLRNLKSMGSDEHPLISGAGDLAGGILNPAFGVGAKAAKAVGTAGAAALGGGRAATMGAGLVSAAGLGAGIGGAQGFGDSQATDAQGMMSDAKRGAEFGAAVGSTLHAAAPVIAPVVGKVFSKAGDVGKSIGKKAMSVLLGPSGEAIDAYLENPNAIRNAPSVEAIKDGIDAKMSGLFSAVDDASLSHTEAKESLKSIEQQVRDHTGQTNFKFKINAADTSQQLEQAQNQLDQAFQAHKAELAATPHPVEMANDIHDSIADLKSQIGRGSQESYSILDNDPKAYSVRGAGRVLRSMADAMNIQPYGADGALTEAGSAARGAPATSQTAGVQSEFHRMADYLENTPEKIPAREVKKILQQLDDTNKAQYGQPGFDSRIGAATKMVRGTIDSAIKAENPEYAEKMQEVARKTGLLSGAIDRFGDPRSALSKLNGIASQTAGPDQALLSQLGQETGRDFESPVQKYLDAQSRLKGATKGALPQTQAVESAQSKLDQMRRPEFLPQMQTDALNESGLGQRQLGAENQVALTGSNLDRANESLEPFKRFGQGQSQNAVSGLLKNPGKESIELRRGMQALSDQGGVDFTGQIENRRLANQFEKNNTNGSRNAVMFGAAGAATGHFLPIPGGSVIGGAIGAQLGGAIDKSGPQMAQSLLDTSLKARRVTEYLKSMPKFAEMAQKNPPAFQAAVQSFSQRFDSGGKIPKAASGDDNSHDSHSTSQYNATPEAPEQSQQKFISGN